MAPPSHGPDPGCRVRGNTAWWNGNRAAGREYWHRRGQGTATDCPPEKRNDDAVNPIWLTILAQIWVLLSVGSALLVVMDLLALARRQSMWIMNVVWPLTMLYWGPVGLAFYTWIGRTPAVAEERGADHGHRHSGHQPRDHGGHGEGGHGAQTPMWAAAFKGASHCGAGCALGDFIGDWLVFLAGFTLLGSELGGKYLAAFVLAYLFGIIFQYFAIAPMRDMGLAEGIVAAIRVDTLSLVAYEIGMFGWMAVRTWMLPKLQPTEITYWFMMQVAMMLGFLTTYPVNWWLIARGTKERM